MARPPECSAVQCSGSLALPSTAGFTVCCDPLLPVAFSWQPAQGGQEGGKFHYEIQLSMAGRGKEFTQVSCVLSPDCILESTDDDVM